MHTPTIETQYLLAKAEALLPTLPEQYGKAFDGIVQAVNAHNELVRFVKDVQASYLTRADWQGLREKATELLATLTEKGR